MRLELTGNLGCDQVGWKHKAAVEGLEAARKKESTKFYLAKKKAIAARAQGVASV